MKKKDSKKTRDKKGLPAGASALCDLLIRDLMPLDRVRALKEILMDETNDVDVRIQAGTMIQRLQSIIVGTKEELKILIEAISYYVESHPTTVEGFNPLRAGALVARADMALKAFDTGDHLAGVPGAPPLSSPEGCNAKQDG